MNIGWIDSNNVEDLFELSPVQRGILYYSISRQQSMSYRAQLMLKLNGEISVELMREAVKMVTARHGMLRTVFRWEGLSHPVQIVLKEQKPSFVFHPTLNLQLAGGMEAVRQNELIRLDLTEQPVRFLLCEAEYRNYHLAISWHHILYDGWSNALVVQELLSVYDCLLTGKAMQPVPKISYKDYIRWCRDSDMNRQERFWSAYLEGFRRTTALPAAKPWRRKDSAARESHVSAIGEELLQGLQELATAEKTTLAILIYTAWAILLYRYTGQKDVVFGATSSGRNADLPHIGQMIGLCINTLPLRVTLQDDQSLKQIVKEITKIWRSCLPYESSDLLDIRRCSELSDEAPLFESIVVVENYPVDAGIWAKEDGEAGVNDFELFETTEFNLVLGVLMPYRNSLVFQYNAGLYDEQTIQPLARHLLFLLDRMAKEFNQPLSAIEWVDREDRRSMLCEREASETHWDFSFDFEL
jgi:hypothetical protein